MTLDKDLDNEVGNERLTKRFNTTACNETHRLDHDTALNRLEEDNINTGLIMGQGTHIGRKDQFHFHDEKQRYDSLENQEKRKKKFSDRIFIRAYLDQLQQTIDALDKEISKLKIRVEKMHDRLVVTMRKLSENDNILDRINEYMTGITPRKQKNEVLGDEELAQFIISMGYSPTELNDVELRLILDKEAQTLIDENQTLKDDIRSDTNRIDNDNKTLQEYEKQKEHLLKIKNKVLQIAEDDSYDYIEKDRAIQVIATTEQLSIDALDTVRRDLKVQENINILDSELYNKKLEDQKTDKDFNASSSNSLSVFMNKPS
jgi:hypothetical protein